ncbi:hypothetical protein VNI00_009216 [Paramarasmius palmivorus]|uniref:F-box domain-containing protein n=1 Tax=Paramarasmius palmivorus TaxID=297713 RepID=A0AAW0CTQ7_9AGAR
MFLRPNDDDTCDTPESLSPELIDLLRSGNPPEAEDHQYARGVVEQLDGKISEYGQAITDLHAQIRIVEGKKASLERKRAHFRALISPIRRIPPEILTSILFLSLQRRYGENVFWVETRSCTLQFGQVCAYWRRIVSSTPQLWAVMTVSANKDHPNVKHIFNHHLERANDAAFYLSLNIEKQAAKSAYMALLIERRHLWRALHLWGEYRHVIPFIQGLERLPHALTVQKLDIDSGIPDSGATRLPDVATHDYLEEILQFIQTKCPDLRCLSLNILTWSGRRPIPHSSFLCQLTSIDLSLPIDIMLNIVNYHRNTLISARLTVHRNLRHDYIDSEMGAIDAVHDLGKISLPCIQNLTVSVVYSKGSTSLSNRHAAALLDSISETPLLQCLVFQGIAHDPYYSSHSRCAERLELFTSILGFIHRSCANLYALELNDLPLDDVEVIQVLQGLSRLKHLVFRAYDSSLSFTTLSSKFMKSMTLKKSAEDPDLVPGLTYLSLEFPRSSSSILPGGLDISEISAMLESRVGTLLPSDDDICDTSDRSSPELIHLLRSGNPPEAEDYQYARGVLEQLDGKISEYADTIANLHDQIRVLEKKKAILERKSAHFRSLTSPIRRIPPEILSYILLSLLRKYPSFGNMFWSSGAYPYPSTLRFSQVCAYWRRIVRSTPQLWAVMSVAMDKSHRFAGSIFNHYLEQAKDAALHLTLDIEGTKAGKSALISLLIQRRHLWRTLCLNGQYERVIPVIQRMRRFPEKLTVQELDIDLRPPEKNLEDLEDHLGDILQFIQRKCPDLRCLSLNIPTWSDRWSILHSSFLRQLTSLDLSLPIDIMLSIMIYNTNTLISARLDVHRNFYINSEKEAINAVRRLGRISLPCIRNLTISIVYSRRSTSLSLQHTAALLDSISETPLLQSLALLDTTYSLYRAHLRCNARLELFASILGFIHRSCTNLYTLELGDFPLADVEVIQLLQEVPQLKHLVVRAHDSSHYFDTLSSKFIKSMTLTQSGEDVGLVPGLKYLSLEFRYYSSASVLPDELVSEISAMLESRVGTLLSVSLVVHGTPSKEELEVLSKPSYEE